jgi:putative glycosyltransferase (TIGR04372 family)
MGLLHKNIKKVIRAILNLLGRQGLDIQKTNSLDFQKRKIQAITNLKSRLSAAKELVRKNPEHPLPHLQLTLCLHALADIQEFDQMTRYAEIMQDWKVKTGFSELDIEFIWVGMVVGSLGNHYALEGLLRANQYKLRPTKKLFLLLPENAQLRNPALTSYFKPYLNIIQDRESIQMLRKLEALMTLPLGICLPLNEGSPFLDIAANRIEAERIAKGLDPALFTLSDSHREMGKKVLQKLGLPKDAWFVTLHVREPGYRGETHENTTENFRNADPHDYIKAIEAVTSSGGWVFRMGDPSMSDLPPMPQLIDYAHQEIRSDLMDVFLGATCSFCIGTSSGYFRIPRYFGVPVLYTNCAPSVEYFSLMEHDLALLSLLKQKNTNKYLSFQELLTPPVSMFQSPKSFNDAGLQSIKNTPEELEAATKEMIKRTNGNNSPESDDLQKRFKILAEKCGQKHGGYSVKAFAPISREFLHKHVDLLE